MDTLYLWNPLIHGKIDGLYWTIPFKWMIGWSFGMFISWKIPFKWMRTFRKPRGIWRWHWRNEIGKCSDWFGIIIAGWRKFLDDRSSTNRGHTSQPLTVGYIPSCSSVKSHVRCSPVSTFFQAISRLFPWSLSLCLSWFSLVIDRFFPTSLL